MKKSELYTLVTSLLDGNEMETTLFSALLDVSQSLRENDRNWVYLRKEDATGSVSSSNTYTTQHSLPSDFRKWYSRIPIVLVDSSGNIAARLSEVPIQEKETYKSDNKFYCDYANGKLYICGNYGQALTIKQYYQSKGTLVSADDDNEWIFPSEYHKILAFDVAVMYKIGVDYDIINNSQGDNNAGVANRIFRAMIEWDGQLAEGGLNGVDYSNYPSGNFTSTSGSLRNLM